MQMDRSGTTARCGTIPAVDAGRLPSSCLAISLVPLWRGPTKTEIRSTIIGSGAFRYLDFRRRRKPPPPLSGTIAGYIKNDGHDMSDRIAGGGEVNFNELSKSPARACLAAGPAICTR